MTDNTQTKLSILAAVAILIAILAGLGLNTTALQDQVDTLVVITTQDVPTLAGTSQGPSETPTVTPEKLTPDPSTKTATPYSGCDVVVRGDWDSFVTIYAGDFPAPGLTDVIATLAPGTVIHVDYLYVVDDVLEEYSHIPEYDGWIRNSPFFPVYDLSECWSLPTNVPPHPTFAFPVNTPGPTRTPWPVACEVTPQEGRDYVNVRSGPGLWGEVQYRLESGKTAVWIENAGDWYRIRMDSGSEGYVAGWVVEKSPSCNE